jgi:hypothetical protein
VSLRNSVAPFRNSMSSLSISSGSVIRATSITSGWPESLA